MARGLGGVLVGTGTGHQHWPCGWDCDLRRVGHYTGSGWKCVEALRWWMRVYPSEGTWSLHGVCTALPCAALLQHATGNPGQPL